MSTPQTYRKLQAIAIGSDFRNVTKVTEHSFDELIKSLGPKNILVKNIHLGINASDVNYTNAKYTPGIVPPFDVGFEGIGSVVAVGSEVTNQKVGNFVVYTLFGSFSEYVQVPAETAIPVPAPNPEFVALQTAGITSSLALTFSGRMTTNETVLVTAAAGGAGQIAVQLAKLAGNHVIGTCSSDEKVAMLKGMGCDRVINYKKEDFAQVLKKEYPRGMDIVIECVGGEFFQTCLNNLAVCGRLVVLGSVSSYTGEGGLAGDNVNTLQLLAGSKTVCGFYLPAYFPHVPAHMMNMYKLMAEGTLKVHVEDKGYVGLEQIADAVEYLHSGKSMGKIVVTLPEDNKSKI
ncbi:alcohol dehydrogenase zinc-binding domain-containing protein [Mucor mucedo]|uniref:alcohol dehydrogenase zinc-binding domain-containing protein n=1 Tax=Mucor mucedo TaxID=29922 RepID=UPI00221F8ACE|nr:alcohol dehydrogenase zinc-binding domain-containing protein [Mucor mucedo]KAI7884740.1 alcohol dehydrogenase zinc-binding domain-containing protein [Mucor mucedo]